MEIMNRNLLAHFEKSGLFLLLKKVRSLLDTVCNCQEFWAASLAAVLQSLTYITAIFLPTVPCLSTIFDS